MIILGINAYHGDSSACIVSDGRLVCAIEEERMRRIKHWAGLPTESIKWCMEYSGVGLNEIDHIAVSRNPSAHLHKKILSVLKKTPKLGFLRNRLQNASKVKDIKTSIAENFGTNPSNLKAKVHNVEHHSAHLGSAFLVSPFDQAVCFSVDGFGDFLSVMRGVGISNKIKIYDWVEYPHSLGILYTAITQYLGFWKYGDEYKVMGLSAYGEPVYLNEMRKIVKLNDEGLFHLDTSFFLHDKHGVDMTWEDGAPVLGRIFSDKFVEAFGKPREEEEEVTQRHQHIAASMQALYEDIFFNMLNDAYQKTGVDKITLAGGCIQNSLANGKIIEKTPFREIYIPPASHDGGTAVGAAFWVWNVVMKKDREFVMTSPYWGPEFSGAEIEGLLKEKHLLYERLDDYELFKRTANDIASGKIVGWFQGRAEWGPRALGNRSILVDPRRKEMKDTLNKRIKRRENFRPFAPSVLEDFTHEWFEESSPVPFMEKVYAIKPEKRKFVPAVVHVDGTGRVQTVSRKLNQKYYGLIEEVYRQTRVPLVLNTSFNDNEPIVNTPSDALNCCLRTKLNTLVLNNYYIQFSNS